MAKDRSLVRASDIGSWTFCNRAWWLAQVQGVKPQNWTALHRGDAMHQAHGQQVARSHQLRRAGRLLLAISLGLMGLLLLYLYLGM